MKLTFYKDPKRSYPDRIEVTSDFVPEGGFFIFFLRGKEVILGTALMEKTDATFLLKQLQSTYPKTNFMSWNSILKLTKIIQ